MSSLSIDHVSSIGHRGPKSTRVNFGPTTTDGVRLWAWVANSIADLLVPGAKVVGDFTIRANGAVETTYTTADGEVVTKRVPTQAIWLNGAVRFEAPSLEQLEPASFSVAEEMAAYAEAWRAKQASAPTAPATDDPF